jgi:type I restriction enzyme S subunit
MKKYDSYKDSGIEWIGEIPSHWGYSPVKYFTEIINGSTPSSSEESYWDGDINWVTTDDLGKLNQKYIFNTRRTITELGYKSCGTTIAPKGSVVISSRAPIGHLGILKIDACTNQGCKTLIPKNINSEFLHYYLLIGKNELEALGQGSTFKELPTSALKGFKIISPPIEEQTTIANYLDQKTTQIDDLIAKKERLIQLLEEERTAIINQAVTKGLDPSVPMKDSGIEWLGEIPDHWELWKISHAFKRIGSGTTPESGNPLYHDNGTINWLNTGDLNDSEVVSCNKKITEQAIKDYTSLKLFPAGSLVMAMYGATIGKTGIIKFDTTTNQACCVFCKGEIIDLKFLQYWFFAKKENIINLAIGGGQPNISQNILKDIRVNCPEISEQIRIVQYLDSSTKEVDLVISKTNEEIELLKEYKTALISEVVTGKVDVRNS